MGTIYCMCGLPGSGKTHFAKDFAVANGLKYFSPDDYHEKINGDACDRSHIFEVWHTMFKDIHDAAVAGENVMIDSDNLTFTQRMQWVEWFPEFKHRVLFYFDRSFAKCQTMMFNRTRIVPIEAMEAKAAKWENPSIGRDRDYWNQIYCLSDLLEDG